MPLGPAGPILPIISSLTVPEFGRLFGDYRLGRAFHAEGWTTRGQHSSKAGGVARSVSNSSRSLWHPAITSRSSSRR